MTEFFLPIVLFLLSAILKLIGPRLPDKLVKVIVSVLVMVLIAVASMLVGIGLASTRPSTPSVSTPNPTLISALTPTPARPSIPTPTSTLTPTPISLVPPKLVNVIKRFDFEDSKDKWELAICNADPCNWFRADTRLGLSRDSFTGKQSLEARVELSTPKQTYSVQYVFDPPIIADGVSARVYVPATTDNPALAQAKEIDIFLEPLDTAPPWPNSKLVVTSPGWYYISLDLRRASDGKGIAFNTKVRQIHIDVVFPPGSPNDQVRFLIDDIEFLKPVSSQ